MQYKMYNLAFEVATVRRRTPYMAGSDAAAMIVL